MIDHSTLNRKQIRMREVYEKPPTYHISRGMGSGCFLDPPGYPTYFIQHVYTQYGNSPPRSTTAVIKYEDQYRVLLHPRQWRKGWDWDVYKKWRDDYLHGLWRPLPLDHHRTQPWITYVHGYFKNCYIDPRVTDYHRVQVGEMHIGPWTNEEIVELAIHLGLRNRSHWYWFMQRSSKWRWTAFIDPLRPEVNALTDRATLYIQEFYPEFQYDPTIPRDQYGRLGHWWEIEDRRPSPDECDGDPRHPGSTWRHPINGTWCQYCGWQQKDEEMKGEQDGQ